MAGSSPIFEATQDNFPQLVLENSHRGLVLVDFWAPWAGPSLRQRELLIGLANEYQGRFFLATVNTDEQKQLAQEYGVRSLPSIKLFRNGRIIEEFHGMQPQADYRQIIDRHIAGPADRVQSAALQAWKNGETDKAIRVLVEGAFENPDNLALPLLLAKILTREDRVEDACAVLAALPSEAQAEKEIAAFLLHLGLISTARAAPEPEILEHRLAQVPHDHQARYQLAALRLVADDVDAALQHLMFIAQQDPEFDDGRAKNGLLAVLDTLEPNDERAKNYRKQLFNLVH